MLDPFGREITYVRVSVTDRCDFRCVYCMAEQMTFLPKAELLTLDDVAEILRTIGRPFVFATGYADKAAPMGFDAPIVRKPYNVHQIARAVAGVTGRA